MTFHAVYPREATLQSLFAVHVLRAPESDAIVFGAERLTYTELDRRSNRLAHHLIGLGVEPGALVGVCLERSAELIVSLLAVVKAGAAYLPLDPGYPAERLRWMLADSGAKVVISRAMLEGLESGCDAPLPERGSALDLAYVMYTSGSTGLPKGVAIPHRGIVRLVVGTDYLSLGPDDRMLQASTPSFDASTFEIWGALLNGACLVGLPREVTLSPRELAAALRRERITALLLTTALFHQVVREVPGAFRTVRQAFLGGEAADPHLLREVLAHGAPGRLVNLYGPTESTVVATAQEVKNVPEGAASVPIGRAIANTEAHEVDGELLVGGDGLARGYWNRPDVTAERFVPNPFAGPADAGSRLYRTGDLVAAREDGAFDFLGRLDQQVKIRGFRIEPGEIEGALAAHPAVRQACVDVRRDAAGEKRLVAWAVAGSAGGIDRAELRRFLSERLPAHMVPSAVVLLDTLPLTPNGKLDRAALPDPDRESAGLEEHVAPRTAMEERLSGLFRELLNVERPGVHDDFFALGGHSLLAGRLISRVRAELGIELPLRDVYEASTVAGLAERAALAGRAERPPIAPADRGRPIPLSFQQERVWFLNELSPGGNIAYNFQATIRLRGPLDPGVLAATLTEIVRRHEVFRTRFPAVDGSPVQEPLPPFPIRLPVADLSALPAGKAEEEAEALVRLEMRQPFDLLEVPLVRWLLIVHAPEDHTLVQVEHHFVHDGWSFARMLLEIRELYPALAGGRPSPLPEPELQYADFAAWQRSWMQGEVLRRHVDHWVGVLAGAPAYLDLPADRPRPPVQSFRGALVRIAMDPALGHRVRAFARERGATLYTSMLAGFSLLMHRLSGQDDLVVGTAAADRPVAELEPMIGMMVNTLPLRVRFAGSPTFAELAAQAQAVALDAYGWQDVPLERVLEALAPVRDPSRNPLFQVMFSFHDSPVPDLDFCGLHGEVTYRHNGSAKNDLNIIGIPRAEQRVGREARPEDDVILLMWEYAADLFDEATMLRMVGQYQRLLSAALDEPDRCADELPLLTAEEARQVLVEWNRTEIPLETGLCVHERVARRAEEAPDALAVDSLTYGELVRRARNLACQLVRLGVEPESRVGVFAERSPEMVTGLLAVLNAGGAYLPIDPAYPPDRIAFVLDDARAPVLLTTSALAGRVPVYGGRVLLLDEDLMEEIPGAGPLPEVDPGQLAYVIYTSGSTGRPKGVQIEHRSLLNLVEWHQREYSVGPADRATLVASPGFDASVWEIWPYLTAGASLHVPPEEVRSEPGALAEWLVRERITISFLPTPLAEAVLEEPLTPLAPLSHRTPAQPGEGGTRKPTGRGRPSPGGGECDGRGDGGEGSLRFLLTGGDALHRGADDSAPFELVNHYGPTENTVVATATLVARGARRPPIGRPISNVRVYVLDPRLQPQPAGVPGELFVGGASLARGYLDRPELTAQRFVPDPFSAGGRLYRTGDRVRHLPDGSLDFLGRVDLQVKVRGFRIELGEIEAALLEHPEVREAAVVARDEPLRLVAYVAADRPLGDELRELISARVPLYMVPSAFVVLPELPVGAHGKIDRAGLPAPEMEKEAAVAPRTPLERQLAAIWEELLPGGAVGVHDGFFERGGHSLLATRLLARVSRELGAEVPLGRFLQAPTVAELARRVEECAGCEALTRAQRESAPLSFPQRRLWFLEQIEPGTAVYNVPLLWRLSGPLDVPALQRSLAEIFRRHEILRTAFRTVDGEPVQIVQPCELTLPVVEVRETEADRLIREESRRPFDLGTGPLLRPLLLRVGPGEHRLLLNLHHIACDGPSAGVLARELEALYAGAPLPELPLQYADFADWQVKRLRGPALEALLVHWRKRLEGVDALDGLPTDRPRPPVQSYRGDHLRFDLPAEVLGPLAALARARGASLFHVLLAGFFAFLQRHTGAGEAAVGTPVASRGRAELEPLVGLFANTLVLRTDMGGDPLFLELLERVRAEVLEALAHQDLPFEVLVEELQPERDLARNPLFQVLFSYREGEIESLRLPGLAVEPLDSGTGTAKLDLTLSISRAGGRLGLRLEYATDLFDRATAERMALRLRTLYTGLAQDPQYRLSELPLLPAEERLLLVEEWNRTAAAVPAGLVHEQIAAQAARTPDAVAVLGRGESWTYAELLSRAGCLAGRLRRLGVGPDVPVGIQMERSPAMVAAVLGVLQAGGAYLPLDPAYPEDRRAFMLADSGAPVVITTLDNLRRTGAPAVPGHPDQLAYVLYTSGSTGRPKGVQVTHRNVLGFFAGMDAVLGTEPGTWMAVTSLSFDISVLELLWTLARGFRVVLPDEGRSLGAQIAEHGATHLQCTPSLAQALAAEDLRPLRKLLLGGEALPPALAAALTAVLDGDLLNMYGPTETTVWSATHRVEAGSGPVPIGRPIANTRIYLLDSSGQPAPLGVPAELAIGGAGVARGYLGRPDLTAERFVPDPFASGARDCPGGAPGARLYRTGDLARWRVLAHQRGELEFLGRLDHQVKIRGHRIELGEVEARLESHPAVSRAVAVARDGSLVAYVVFRHEPIAAAELRDWVRSELPEAMVPSLVVHLDALPLTPNGKVDRRALPAPELPRGAAQADPPRGSFEELLAAIWWDALGVDGFGRDADFFELGGHSLLVMKVVARVRELLGVELPPRVLFESPTLAGLASRVAERVLARQGEQEAGGVPADLAALSHGEVRALLDRAVRELGGWPELRRRGGSGPAPLSFAQQRLWFLDRLEPGGSAYNLAGGIRLAGDLDAEALAAALSEVVRRHEVLRTSFVEADGSAAQVVAPPSGILLPRVDLSGRPDVEAALEEAAGIEAQRPFDLARGPLLRCLLVRLGERQHALVLVVHHIVFDGWSFGVLIRELGRLYAAFAAGCPSPLPEIPIQYADFAIWQREWLQGRELERQLGWWKELLAGAPAVLELPVDRPRPSALAEPTRRGGRVSLAIPAELRERLEAAGRRLGLTPFMACFSAFLVLLARTSGQEDLVVGTPVAGRSLPETEDLVGLFANTLALRGRVEGTATLGQVAGRVRELALGAFAHQELPFEKLVNELQLDRDLARSPLFQVLFILQNAPRPDWDLPGLAVSPLTVDSGQTPFGLVLTLVPHAGDHSGLEARVHFDRDLFDDATILRLAGRYRTLLESIAEAPAAWPVSSLAWMPDAELRELVARPPACEIPASSLHQTFEAQAARLPEAVAAVFGDEVLTYAELNRRANRLARHLRALGAGPEVPVGLCLERSADLLVALLAVLKSGSFYVPLDPAYPRDRLAWVLEDAAAPLLVTRADLREILREVLPESRARIVDLDRPEAWAGESGDDPEALASPENLAYAIYTSGSTGRPKGVQVRHRGAANFLASMAGEPGLGEGDTLLAVTTLAFDIAVLELLLPLTVGARVLIASREEAGDGMLLRERLEASKATVLQATPATWRMLLEAGWEGSPDLKALCGGEALPRELADRLQARTRELWNVYGPTETTVWSAVERVEEGGGSSAPLPLAIPLGRPVANTGLYVVDAWGGAAPLGVPGELWIGGEGLARGYLGRPDLTAERFTPDPFSGEPGARLYRTGDLVRRRASGELEFLGRLDHQVKIRGFRIELGEIEAVLAAQPGVRDCAVVVREDVPGAKRLVAYLAPHLDAPAPDPGLLRAALRERLPDYMVPQLFVPLLALPLTPNGKTDRRALLAGPAPEADRAAADYAAPRHRAEEVLAAVWAEVLRLDRVGIHDNFFALGGDSVMVIQAATRSRRLGFAFQPRQLFQAQTVAGLAGLLGEALPADAAAIPEFSQAGLSQAELEDLISQLG
jgi:amino acid adenylation domain-containing protein